MAHPLAGAFERRSPARTAARRGTRRGQALVEFSLVIPLFLLFVFGIIDGGRALFAYNQVSQATRNVARVASVSCFDPTGVFSPCDKSNDPAVATAIANQGAGIQGPVTWTVQCVDPNTNTVTAICAVGDLVRVNATLQFNLLYGAVKGDFGTVNVGSTSEQQILQ